MGLFIMLLTGMICAIEDYSLATVFIISVIVSVIVIILEIKEII